MTKQRKGLPLPFSKPIEVLLKSAPFTSVRIANLPQQCGLASSIFDSQGGEHPLRALKLFFLQHTAYSAKECYRPGGGAKYISATSKVSLCERDGQVVDVFRTELFDCANFGACRQRGGFQVWPEQALPGDRLHCVFSSGNFINSKAAHPSANTLGGIPKIAATNCSVAGKKPVPPAHTIVGVYADEPIIAMTFDPFEPLCSAHGCAANDAGPHCSYAHGQACKRATLPAYVMHHVILLQTPGQDDCWHVAARAAPYLQYRFETLTLSKEAQTVRDENPSESMLLRAARLQAAQTAASPKKRKTTAESFAAASSASPSSAAAAAGPASAASSSESMLTPVESQQRIIDQRRANRAASEEEEPQLEVLPAARAYKTSKKHSRAATGAGAGSAAAAAQPASAAAAGRPPKLKRKSSVMDDDESSQSSASALSRASSIAGGKSKVRAINTNGASSSSDDEEAEEEERVSCSNEEISSDEEEAAQASIQQRQPDFSSRPAVLVRRGRPAVAPIQLPSRHSINGHALFGLDSPVGGINDGYDWSVAGSEPRVLASPEPMPSHHTLGVRCSSGSMPLATPPFCRTPARPCMSPVSGGSGFLGRRRRSFIVSQPASGGWMSRSGSNTAVQPHTPLTASREEPDETQDDTMQPQQHRMQHQTQSHELIRSDGMLPLSSSNPTTPGLPAVPSAVPSAVAHGRPGSMSSLLRSLTINIHSAVPAWPQPSPLLPYDSLASAPLAPTPLSAAPGEIDITMT